ncbi:MAG: hypothetical protein ACO3SP_04445 [Ilumatobacteraceae bacterium]
MGTVSPDDRRRMNRQAAALRALETSEAGDDEQRVAAIVEANEDRRRHGLDELKTEGEFHRKAVERGFIRRWSETAPRRNRLPAISHGTCR